MAKKSTKPFFYRVDAAEFMSAVFQIPDGKHKEWVSQLAIDLVAGVGTSEYSKRIIQEVNEYRAQQAEFGKTGGRPPKPKDEETDPIPTLNLPLTDPEPTPNLNKPSSSSSSSSSTVLPTKEECTREGVVLAPDGGFINTQTGEVVETPFG